MNMTSRREFLKGVAKISAGVSAVTILNPLVTAFAENETPATAESTCAIIPSRLVEVEASEGHKKTVGYRYFDYTTSGTTCSKRITFAIKEDTMTVHGVDVQEACTGTSDCFAALCEGRTIDDCVTRMLGIMCHVSPDSSCPDQTAQALMHAKKYLLGETCECAPKAE